MLLKPSPDSLGSNARRPADVYLPNWRHGVPAALDIAVTSPQRQDIVHQASVNQGAAATSYERHKRTYLDTEQDCTSQGIAFVPIVAKVFCGWGTSAICTFKSLAKLADRDLDANNTNEPNRRFRLHLQQSCTAIRRANARAVLRRAQGREGRGDDAMVAASGSLAS